MLDMYKGMVNSPETTITNDINNTDTLIYVLDETRIPEELPNLMVLGTGTSAETIKVLSIDGNAITVERGFQGTPRNWNAGTVIARNFTEYDYNALKENIETLDKEIGNLDSLSTEEKSNLVGAINEVCDDLDEHKAENVNQGNPHGIDAKANKVQENWRTVTLLNGWGEVYPVGIRKNEFGNIEFKGVVYGGAIDNDTTLFSLPEDCRATSNRRIVTVGYDDSAVNIQYAILNVTTSGDVRLFRVSSSNLQYLSLDGVVLFR